MCNKILIVDDDMQLGMLLKKCLENERLEVSVMYEGKNVIKEIEGKDYQLIILDIMLPDISGFELLGQIRNLKSVPVLMLTARAESKDKVKGFNIGADDYLTKPFDIDELIARVISLIRRGSFHNEKEMKNRVLNFQNLTIYADNRIVYKNGMIIELSVKEFDILHLLASNQGRVLTKKKIYEEVWNEEYAYDDATIMVYISHLRKKIESNQDFPKYIQTVKGLGYRFNREV